MATTNKASVPKDEIVEAKTRVVDATSKIREGVQDIVGESKKVASIGREYAEESVNHGLELVNEKSSELMHALQSTVKQKPLQSMAIAAGIGVLLGGFLKRSGS